jgi:hypothetical protein
LGEKNRVFKASTLSEGVQAVVEVVRRFGIVRGVRGKWLLHFAHYASGHSLLLPLATSATAALRFTALAVLMAVH